MWLQRIDLFKIFFVFFLIGICLYDSIPKVVPLRYPIQQNVILYIVLLALFSFLIGEGIHRLIERKDLHFNNRVLGFGLVEKQRGRKIIIVTGVLFALFAIYGGSLFFERGVPIFERGEDAALLKMQLNLNSMGRTRVIDIILPFLSLVLYGLYLSLEKHSLIIRCFVFSCIGLTLAFLLARLFKGNVVIFLLGLVFIKEAVGQKKYKLLTVSNFRLLMLLVMLITAVYFSTEGDGVMHSLLYLFNRLVIYSWEGFNYLIYINAEPDIYQQLSRVFSFKSSMESPGTVLAMGFYETENPVVAISPTFFGFLYRNGEELLVILGFLILGFLKRNIIYGLEKYRFNILRITLSYYLYIMLLKIFLVGNLFDELRGQGLTLLFIYVFIMLVMKIKFSTLVK